MKKISKILAPVAAILMMLSNCPKPSAMNPNMSKFTTLQAVYAMCQGKQFDVALESLKRFGMVNQKAAEVLSMVLLAPLPVDSEKELNALLKICPNIETVQLSSKCFPKDVWGMKHPIINWKSLRWTRDNSREYKNIIIHNYRSPYDTGYTMPSWVLEGLMKYYQTGECLEGFELLPGIAEELYPYVVGFSGVNNRGVEKFCNLKVWRGAQASNWVSKPGRLNALKSLKLDTLSVKTSDDYFFGFNTDIEENK